MWVSANRASRVLYNFLLSIEKPDVFLVPANVCPIVLATFLKAKVSFRLVDIDQDSLCIDLIAVKDILSDSNTTFGLIFVRTFGHTGNCEADIVSMKSQYSNLKVIIDDRCLGIPELDQTRFSEEIDMTLFSTGYSKFVELGYGGFAWLSEKYHSRYHSPQIDYIEDAHEILVRKFNHAIQGRTPFNYDIENWLDDRDLPISLESYFSKIKSETPASLKQKSTLNAIYRQAVPQELWLGEEFNLWRFSILVSNKQAVLDSIFSAGEFASSHYASMAGIFDDTTAPVAESIHSQIVNLFNDYRFTEAKAKRVAGIVKKEAKK
ncbi:hypothetical protein [Vibrio maritimus]|uniref:hypothetical protein n=1 Tax=Vibrio maritimus TaxID=990268 RepID=UPI001F4200B8|nr:hypothetical protein [Vibrio maritimus]